MGEPHVLELIEGLRLADGAECRIHGGGDAIGIKRRERFDAHSNLSGMGRRNASVRVTAVMSGPSGTSATQPSGPNKSNAPHADYRATPLAAPRCGSPAPIGSCASSSWRGPPPLPV